MPPRKKAWRNFSNLRYERLTQTPNNQIRSTDSRSVRLHDLEHEEVQLSVFLFAHFSDLIRPRLVPIDDGALGRRSIATGKFHNDSRRRTATEVEHFAC